MITRCMPWTMYQNCWLSHWAAGISGVNSSVILVFRVGVILLSIGPTLIVAGVLCCCVVRFKSSKSKVTSGHVSCRHLEIFEFFPNRWIKENEIWCVLTAFTVVDPILSIGGSKGGRQVWASPLGPIFFIFMQFLWNNWPNNSFSFLPFELVSLHGNPGSATDKVWLTNQKSESLPLAIFCFFSWPILMELSGMAILAPLVWILLCLKPSLHQASALTILDRPRTQLNFDASVNTDTDTLCE